MDSRETFHSGSWNRISFTHECCWSVWDRMSDRKVTSGYTNLLLSDAVSNWRTQLAYHSIIDSLLPFSWQRSSLRVTCKKVIFFSWLTPTSQIYPLNVVTHASHWNPWVFGYLNVGWFQQVNLHYSSVNVLWGLLDKPHSAMRGFHVLHFYNHTLGSCTSRILWSILTSYERNTNRWSIILKLPA